VWNNVYGGSCSAVLCTGSLRGAFGNVRYAGDDMYGW
jgi:hypothetical protein